VSRWLTAPMKLPNKMFGVSIVVSKVNILRPKVHFIGGTLYSGDNSNSHSVADLKLLIGENRYQKWLSGCQ